MVTGCDVTYVFYLWLSWKEKFPTKDFSWAKTTFCVSNYFWWCLFDIFIDYQPQSDIDYFIISLICSAARNKIDSYLRLNVNIKRHILGSVQKKHVILSRVIILLQWSIIQGEINLEKAKETPVHTRDTCILKPLSLPCSYYAINYCSLHPHKQPTMKCNKFMSVLWGWTKVILRNVSEQIAKSTGQPLVVHLNCLDSVSSAYIPVDVDIFFLATTSLDWVYRCVGKLLR